MIFDRFGFNFLQNRPQIIKKTCTKMYHCFDWFLIDFWLIFTWCLDLRTFVFWIQYSVFDVFPFFLCWWIYLQFWTIWEPKIHPKLVENLSKIDQKRDWSLHAYFDWFLANFGLIWAFCTFGVSPLWRRAPFTKITYIVKFHREKNANKVINDSRLFWSRFDLIFE